MIVIFALLMISIGCSNDDQSEENMIATSEEANEELTLQMLKVDEEAGLTLADNEFYQAIQATIDAEPHMGETNDFSILPLSTIDFEDDGKALLFLAINRTQNPLKNVAFELTFGHQDGTYILENEEVDLSEDYIGVLEENSAIPFFLDITDEDEEIFKKLTNENTLMEMKRFRRDY